MDRPAVATLAAKRSSPRRIPARGRGTGPWSWLLEDWAAYRSEERGRSCRYGDDLGISVHDARPAASVSWVRAAARGHDANEFPDFFLDPAHGVLGDPIGARSPGRSAGVIS